MIGRVRAFVRRWLWAEPGDDVDVSVGRCVRGWVVCALAGLVAAALALTFGAGATQWSSVALTVLVLGTFVLVTWWPGLVALPIAAAGVVVLVTGVPPLGVLLALVLLSHGALALATVAVRVRFDTLVEWRVIGIVARDFALVQVGAQVLAVGAAALAGADLRAGDGVRTIALLTVLVVLVVVLPRFDRPLPQRRHD